MQVRRGGQRADRRRADVADRVGARGRADRGGLQIRHDVGRQIRRVRLSLVVGRRPLLLGVLNQAQVVDAGALAGLLAGLQERGNGNRGEQCDDCDHDHDFNQCEPLAVHDALLLLLPDLIALPGYSGRFVVYSPVLTVFPDYTGNEKNISRMRANPMAARPY